MLDGIRAVESGGERYPAFAVGDGGRSLGPYQISYGFWRDAAAFKPELAEGTWAMCLIEEYAEKVVLAYWAKHAPDMPSWENLARIHNGGPRGHGRAETAAYWRKVEKQIYKK